MTSSQTRTNAIQPGDRCPTSPPYHFNSSHSPTAMAAYRAIHGKNSPGKPNRYLSTFFGRGGHSSRAGTVSGNSGDHPPTVELGMSLGELIGSFLPVRTRA